MHACCLALNKSWLRCMQCCTEGEDSRTLLRKSRRCRYRDSGQTDSVVSDGVSDRKSSAGSIAALLTEPKCADDGMEVQEDPLRLQDEQSVATRSRCERYRDLRHFEGFRV